MNKYFYIFYLFIFVQSHFEIAFAKNENYLLSTAFIIQSTKTQQAGQASEGSTILSQTEFVIQKKNNWGYGLLYQYDQQGSFQKDTAFGLKLEGNYKKIYFDLGYLLSVQRVYNDRTYEKESGDGYYLGFGARIDLYKKMYLNLNYKYRVQNIKKQDSNTLAEPITQTDSYPLIGLGVQF